MTKADIKKPDIRLPEGDWPVTFDAVSLAQHLRFRALSPRQKISALEDMEALVRMAAAARRLNPQGRHNP